MRNLLLALKTGSQIAYRQVELYWLFIKYCTGCAEKIHNILKNTTSQNNTCNPLQKSSTYSKKSTKWKKSFTGIHWIKKYILKNYAVRRKSAIFLKNQLQNIKKIPLHKSALQYKDDMKRHFIKIHKIRKQLYPFFVLPLQQKAWN